MEELDLPKLNGQQIEQLCQTAENSAREYVLSRVSPKRIEQMNISVETKGAKPVRLTVEVDIILSPLIINLDTKKLADEAVREAFISAEDYLKELACRSKK
ncbi:DUF3194 domain-containing protein [Candidatus Bathyarchaeota archaeon]|nr:DUF3194 domain-containing protein [Candidatus Bathyarchaeota archaeon]